MSNKKDIPVFHPSFDFDTLMREALKHITALTGDLWSDHNASDPGITQLEVLAFCIADLSYRTSFDVKDIVAGYKGGLTVLHDLPLANVALPNHPVTIKDLRKLLVDMFHPDFLESEQDPTLNPYPTKLLVRNAFPIIAKENEVPFYAVSKYGKESFLTFDTSFDEIYGLEPLDSDIKPLIKNRAVQTASHLQATAGVINQSTIDKVPAVLTPFGIQRKKKFNYLDPIELNGLYSIQIEFENDLNYNKEEELHLHDLNQNYFIVPIQMGDIDYEIKVLMPYWDDIRWSLRNVDMNDQNNHLVYEERGQHDYFIAVDKLNYDDYFYDYYAEVNLAGYSLPMYIKTQFIINDNERRQGIPHELNVGGKTYRFTARFLDWNELANGVNRNYSGAGNPHALTPNQSNINAPNDWDLEIFRVGIEGEQPTWDIKSVFNFKKETAITDNTGSVTYNYDKDKTINLLTRIVFDEGTIIRDDEVAQIETALKAKYPYLFHQQIVLEDAVKDELVNRNAQMYQNYLEKINRVFRLLYEENGIWSYLGKYRNLCEDFAHFSASRVQEVALFGDLIVAPNYNVNALLAEIYFRIDQFLSPLVKFNSLSEMVEKGYQFEDLFNGPLLKNGFIENKDLNDLKRRSVVYTSDLIRIIMDVDGVEAVENFNISSYIDNRLMGRNVVNCLKLTNSDIYKPRFTSEKTQLNVWVSDEKQALSVESINAWYEEKKRDAKTNQISDPDNSPLNPPTGNDMEIEKYYSIQHDFPEVYGIGDFGLPLDATEERQARAKQLKAYLLPFEQLLANYLKQVAHLPELFSLSRNVDRTYQYQPLYEVPDVAPLFAPFQQSTSTWEDFKQDLNNAYQTQLGAMESEELFRNRRNRFLNQLLARFGESFMAYATQMFDRNKTLLNDINGINDFRMANSETLKKLINDQIAFGEDYPMVSGERYKSFDTTIANPDHNSGTWNNTNIASFKRRLCRLLGIENIENKFIFQTHQNTDGDWVDEEGMHIVEHILLRPRTQQAKLLGLKNESIQNAQGSYIFDSEKDPYSFRITIVLPRYAGRFKEKSFRQFTEHLIRMETPAHIRVDFRWMTGDCGKKFEVHYHHWKQNIYKLKPYFFANIDSNEQMDHVNLVNDSVTDFTRLKTEGANSKAERVNVATLKKRVEENKAKIVSSSDESELRKTPEMTLNSISGANREQVMSRIRLSKRPSILDLQDNMVRALQASCELKLEAFNKNDLLFTPQHGKITFEAKKTDVFHLRVNEIGGNIAVYKMNRQKHTWVSQAEMKPITENYFDINEFIDATDGLTTKFGGRGMYKIVYELEGHEPEILVIDVTKSPIKPSIQIGRSGEWADDTELLDFNTETDGVFQVSNQHWAVYFLQFQPASIPANPEFDEDLILGKAYIESADKGLEKTALFLGEMDDNNCYTVDFDAVYEKFGFGTYYITYMLDGEISFAEIQLSIELSITVFDGKTQLLPNEEDTVIIPSNLRKVNLLMDVPEGELTVYDLDVTAERQLNKEEAIQGFNEFGDYPNGAVAYYKKVDHLLINRDDETLYKDDHRYQFVYKHSGEQVSVILLFEAPVIEVKPPSVKLFEYGKEMVEPYVLMIDGNDHNYKIEFHPKDAEVTGWIMDNGQEKIIENFIVPSDYYTDTLQPGEVLKENGAGPIFIKIANEAGEAELDFIIKQEQLEPTATTLEILNLATKEVVEKLDGVYNLIYDYQNPDQLFEMTFNNGEGELTIVNEDGEKALIPIEGNWVVFNGVEPLIKGLQTGDYKCIYQPKNGLNLEFSLNVINLNPSFVLSKIGYDRPYYFGTGTPLYPNARNYIWRIDGEYVSRAKNPELRFDFQKKEKYIVRLTMHLEDFEASYEVVITLDLMKKWSGE